MLLQRDPESSRSPALPSRHLPRNQRKNRRSPARSERVSRAVRALPSLPDLSLPRPRCLLSSPPRHDRRRHDLGYLVFFHQYISAGRAHLEHVVFVGHDDAVQLVAVLQANLVGAKFTNERKKSCQQHEKQCRRPHSTSAEHTLFGSFFPATAISVHCCEYAAVPAFLATTLPPKLSGVLPHSSKLA